MIPVLRTWPRLARPRPLRLLFWLLLAVPVGLLAYAGGRHLWACHHLRAAEGDIEQYAFARALPHLDCCLQVWPDSLPTRLLAARTARRAGRLDLARAQLTECQRLAPAAPEVLLEDGLLRCQTGELGPAEEEDLWGLVKEGGPQAGFVLEALTAGYLYTYRPGRAKRCAELLLVREPNHVPAFVWRGWVREGAGDYHGALADYRKALDLDPGHEQARLHLAAGLVTHGRPAEALEQFEELRRRGADPVPVLVGLAHCRRLLGQADEAARLLDQALAVYPPSAAALRERGALAQEAGRLGEAERCLRRSLDLDPSDAQAHFSLSQVLRRAGKTEEAARCLARSRRVAEDSKRLGQIVGLLSRSPGDAALYSEAGTICLRNGQAGEGLRWLRGALQADPHHQPAHQALADYYERAGQPEQARYHRAQGCP